MTYTYTIPGRLAGANEAINRAKGGIYLSNRLKRAETKRCALAAIVGQVPKLKKPIRLHFHWVEPNRRRDLDNIRYAAKFVIDGLRECRKLENDGWRWIVGMSDTWQVDPKNPHIEVKITELEFPK